MARRAAGILKRFLAPVGGFLDSPQEMVQELLSTKVVGDPVFDMCCQIADILKERGVTLAESAIASCMRAAHRAQFDDLTPDPYHCSTQDVPEEYRPFVEQAILSWYGGLLDYARSVGVQPPVDQTGYSL